MSGGGARLFARYAYAPNELGYCGPAGAAALFELASTGHTDADIVAVAKSFRGAWPYLVILAALAGIDDPLDERVVRAYWVGGELLSRVDRQAFGSKLVATLGSQAGHYWQHLSADLIGEVTATHGFHVLGVYPWSRLLLGDRPEVPLQVLDDCRIRWGRVLTVETTHATVRCRRLSWDGRALSLAPPGPERVRIDVDGRTFVAGVQPGDWLALHWDWACERLAPVDLEHLRHWTNWQLRVTNRRLAAPAVPVG